MVLIRCLRARLAVLLDTIPCQGAMEAQTLLLGWRWLHTQGPACGLPLFLWQFCVVQHAIAMNVRRLTIGNGLCHSLC